jgi:hypothetical protein
MPCLKVLLHTHDGKSSSLYVPKYGITQVAKISENLGTYLGTYVASILSELLVDQTPALIYNNFELAV